MLISNYCFKSILFILYFEPLELISLEVSLSSQQDSKPRKAKCLSNRKKERSISTRLPSGSAACDSASQLLYCMKCCLLTCRKEMHIWWRMRGQTTYLEEICMHFKRERKRKKKEYKVSIKYEERKKKNYKLQWMPRWLFSHSARMHVLCHVMHVH